MPSPIGLTFRVFEPDPHQEARGRFRGQDMPQCLKWESNPQPLNFEFSVSSDWTIQAQLFCVLVKVYFSPKLLFLV